MAGTYAEGNRQYRYRFTGMDSNNQKNIVAQQFFNILWKFWLQKSLYLWNFTKKILILTVTFRRSNIFQKSVILHVNKAKILSRFLELGLPNAAAQAQQLFIFS